MLASLLNGYGRAGGLHRVEADIETLDQSLLGSRGRSRNVLDHSVGLVGARNGDAGLGSHCCLVLQVLLGVRG